MLWYSQSMEETLKNKLKNYKTPKKAVEIVRNTKVVFLVGISGAGKDTLRKELLFSGAFHHIVSHTTRSPRHNLGVLEQDGLDYHFVDFKKIEKMLENQEFVEAKMFSNNIYGTSIAEIQVAHDDNKVALSDLEVQGVAEYMSISSTVRPIFLLPPNYEVWQDRLKQRYHDNEIDPTDMSRRIQTAKQELQEAFTKDYFYFVVNDSVDKSLKQVKDIAYGSSDGYDINLAKELIKSLLDSI